MTLAASLAGYCQAPSRTTPAPNRPPLQPNAFHQLPLTSVLPKGWLLEQLRIQAKGLSGHLDEFWPDLGPTSGWLGGTGESWERGPYFLDGLVPLAYLTQDARLIAKVKRWMDWTLDHQQPSGWIGPVKNEDWWPNYVMLKALTQYQEATGDARVIPLMQKYYAFQLKHLDERPLKEWAILRWHDGVLSVLWLYNRTGDRSLLDLARKLHGQGHDWEAQFANFLYRDKVTRADAHLATHGVNNAMGLKAAPVWWLLTGQKQNRDGFYRMFEMLDRYHGQPAGIFAADEHYAGRDPSQGTELCAVVEAMFSLEVNLAILGDPMLGDRLERISYNALPATLSADLWAHQYDQQANQVLCTLATRRWVSNGPAANIFGLEPNFGCCTANMHQGWPKLAANLWMATPDGGLAAVAYGPSEVSTLLAGGTAVRIEEQTDYPFRETVSLAVRPERQVKFPLVLRIPAWADGASVAVNGQAMSGVQPGRFFRVEREWRSGDKVEIRFPMPVRTSTWFNNSIAVERGPLVYSLKIGESWHKIRQIGPAADWEIYPTTPWNFAITFDGKTPAGQFQVRERPLGSQPFSPEGAPVEILARGRRLPSWQIVDDSAGPLPSSPVPPPARNLQPEQELTLIPYGSAKLRVTAFPYMVPVAAPAAAK
ncbi:MAG: glycoside hydrolase family 127 protein [Bryobacterales bacterium]|nr:glycoside hydrolase family 127 protein [Bryobacterales bacterium]